MVMLKLIGEERKGRAEHFLARVVSRYRLMTSALVISLVTSFVMLSASGIGLWSAGTAVVEDGMDFGRIYSAALVYLPAVWILALLSY